MEGFVPEGMSTQAQQIWSMLDDMAQNDPAAYRKFIEKQMKEGKEHMAQPDPHMCVQVTLLSKSPKPLYINFMSWNRVPEPKTPEDAVPVSGAPITQEKDSKGPFALTSVAFNPKVLEEFGRNCQNPRDADTLVQLALDYVEHEHNVKVTRTYTVLPETTPLKGELEVVRLCFTKAFQRAHNNKNGSAGGDGSVFYKDVSELERTFGPLSSSERESLMSQLSNISNSVSDDKDQKSKNSRFPASSDFTPDSGSSHSIKIPGMATDFNPNYLSKNAANNGFSPRTKGPGSSLIQEISEDKASGKAPKYTLETRGDPGNDRQLVLKIELPGVKSVAECELDISEDDVKLVVPGQHDWRVKLPAFIDKDLAKARFSKKYSLLTLNMPLKL